MSVKVWSKSFILASLESAVTTGLSTFAAALVVTNGAVTAKGAIAAAVAGGIAVVYTFAKNLGGVQALKANSTSAK